MAKSKKIPPTKQGTLIMAKDRPIKRSFKATNHQVEDLTNGYKKKR